MPRRRPLSARTAVSQRLIAEKQKALETAAPPVSLQVAARAMRARCEVRA